MFLVALPRLQLVASRVRGTAFSFPRTQEAIGTWGCKVTSSKWSSLAQINEALQPGVAGFLQAGRPRGRMGRALLPPPSHWNALF